MRSAIRPAVRTEGAADQGDGDDLGKRARADVIAVPDGFDGTVDDGAVVAEEEATHRGGGRDEDDMARWSGWASRAPDGGGGCAVPVTCAPEVARQRRWTWR
jgi:hypothetical protein